MVGVSRPLGYPLARPVLPGMYVDPEAGTTPADGDVGLAAAVVAAGDDAAGRSNEVVGRPLRAGGGVIADAALDIAPDIVLGGPSGIANIDGFGAALVVAGMPDGPLGSVNPPDGGAAAGVDDAGKDDDGIGMPEVMLNVVGADGGAV